MVTVTDHYAKQTWENFAAGDTPLAKRRLNPMEDGIWSATEGVITLETWRATLELPSGFVQVGDGEPGPGTPLIPPLYLDGSVDPNAFWLYNSVSEEWVEALPNLFQVDEGAPDGLTPTVPKFYIDSDTGILYAYVDFTWIALAGGGGESDITFGDPIQFGTGVPDGGTPITPILYADTSTTPYNVYAYESAAWHLTGNAYVQSGAGVPDGGTPVDPLLYVDTSATPYQPYWYDGAAWNLLGDGGVGSLVQFNSGAPDGGTPTTPSLYADTSITPYTLYAYDGADWNVIGGGSSVTVPDHFETMVIVVSPAGGTPDANYYLLSDTSPMVNGTFQGGGANGFMIITPYSYKFLNNGSRGGWQIINATASGPTGEDMLVVGFGGDTQYAIRLDFTVSLDGLAAGDSVQFDIGRGPVCFVKVDDTDTTFRCKLTEFIYNSLHDSESPPDSPTVILRTAATDVSVTGLEKSYSLLLGTNATVRTPAAPTGVAGDVSVPGQVTITWDAPGVAILGTRVEPQSAGAITQFIDYGTEVAVFTGLTPGDYYFNVIAINEYGTSAASIGPLTVT